jgi:spore coat polysaccharide biosynthesis protein SpsF
VTTTCVIQARTGSTRLPGKVLIDLAGRPLLAFMVERLRTLDVDHLVVATSDLPADDPIDELTKALRVPVVRGPEQDVLARFGVVIDSMTADHVIRLTADCPLIDPAVIAEALQLHLQLGADYTSNTLARTYPDGLDVEVIRTAALAEAVRDAVDPAEREHVTPFVYRRPERFGLSAVCSGQQLGAERWTVDTEDDLARVRSIVEQLDDPVRASWHEVLAIAGQTAGPARGSVWLRPECWTGLSFRRAWDVLVDTDVVGRATVELTSPGRGRLTYTGDAEHRVAAVALVDQALAADRQIVDLDD